jgi:hypothetical protein
VRARNCEQQTDAGSEVGTAKNNKAGEGSPQVAQIPQTLPRDLGFGAWDL